MARPYDLPRRTSTRRALKALELDPRNAEAHTYLGLIEWFYDWKFDAP
jgi:hypothetical protein